MAAHSIQVFNNGRNAHNERGGLMARYINKTGGNSVKGTIVSISASNDLSVEIAPANAADSVGVVYNDGIADGSGVWVVISGPAQVLLKDGTTATRDNWGSLSTDTAGRGNFSLSAPPSGGYVQNQAHLALEIGHVMESKEAGTNVLCWCHTHFN